MLGAKYYYEQILVGVSKGLSENVLVELGCPVEARKGRGNGL